MAVSRSASGRRQVAEGLETGPDLDTTLSATDSGCRLWLPQIGRRGCECRCRGPEAAVGLKSALCGGKSAVEVTQEVSALVSVVPLQCVPICLQLKCKRFVDDHPGHPVIFEDMFKL